MQKNVKSSQGLGDSDSDDEGDIMFDPILLYKQILEYLKPGESVSKTLCRLGKYGISKVYLSNDIYIVPTM